MPMTSLPMFINNFLRLSYVDVTFLSISVDNNVTVLMTSKVTTPDQLRVISNGHSID